MTHTTSRGRRNQGEITLARAISKFGIASRTQAAAMVREGRVAVDGSIVRSPDRWVNPLSNEIQVDGKRIRRASPVYLAMHKPIGVVTTRSDEKGRKTIYHLLPPERQWMFPIGRLDKETSGLLLLTNDSRFGEMVTNPLGEIPKTYSVTVDRPLRDVDRRALESRLTLADGTRLLPAEVTPSIDNPLVFEMTIVEGKNRQIRRMCEHLGYVVISLQRIRIGLISLGRLNVGEVRPLSREERSGILSSFASGE
ncbi:MAG TPA: pseudouridine synthase [Bacteroidota bacterium]|nr:pseudouridine synthase [Bacteroidota bacterium]